MKHEIQRNRSTRAERAFESGFNHWTTVLLTNWIHLLVMYVNEKRRRDGRNSLARGGVLEVTQKNDWSFVSARASVQTGVTLVFSRPRFNADARCCDSVCVRVEGCEVRRALGARPRGPRQTIRLSVPPTGYPQRTQHPTMYQVRYLYSNISIIDEYFNI